MIPKLLVDNSDEAGKLLRRPAKKVKNPQATETIIAIQTMKKLAHQWEQETGYRAEGLAAPQVGINQRIIIVRDSDEMKPRKPAFDGAINLEELEQVREYREWLRVHGSTYDPWRVLINPVIVSESGHQWSVEGCLSLPGKSFKVARPSTIFFKYTTPEKKSSYMMVAKGPSAAALKHELDHLDGLLLVDVASEVYLEEVNDPL